MNTVRSHGVCVLSEPRFPLLGRAFNPLPSIPMEPFCTSAPAMRPLLSPQSVGFPESKGAHRKGGPVPPTNGKAEFQAPNFWNPKLALRTLRPPSLALCNVEEPSVCPQPCLVPHAFAHTSSSDVPCHVLDLVFSPIAKHCLLLRVSP